MLLEENQIAFHSEDGLIFDGVKDYSRQLAEMVGLGSDAEFPQAGVSVLISSLINCSSWGNSMFERASFCSLQFFVWLNRKICIV